LKIRQETGSTSEVWAFADGEVLPLSSLIARLGVQIAVLNSKLTITHQGLILLAHEIYREN
jgi:hypothetical protein